MRGKASASIQYLGLLFALAGLIVLLAGGFHAGAKPLAQERDRGGVSQERSVQEWMIFLPVAMKPAPLPATPVLNPISNANQDGNFIVDWDKADEAETYTLEEDDNADFSSPETKYNGTGTLWSASDQPPGTYFYRVQAHNAVGSSNWSNIQSVIVAPTAALWTGTTNRGYPMSFEVAVDWSEWENFKLKTDFSTGNCIGTIETTAYGPGPIIKGIFSLDFGDYSFAGQLSSPTEASGSYAYSNKYIPNCGYFSQSGTWTASAPNNVGTRNNLAQIVDRVESAGSNIVVLSENEYSITLVTIDPVPDSFLEWQP